MKNNEFELMLNERWDEAEVHVLPVAYKELTDGRILLRLEVSVHIPGQPLYIGQAVVMVPAMALGWEGISEPDEDVPWLDDKDDDDFDAQEEDYWRRMMDL